MPQSIYLKKAIEIADQLIERAEYDEHGLYWKNMSTDNLNNNAVIWNISDSIYNGTTGIILFFVELYKVVPNKKYLEVIQKSASWLIGFSKKYPTNFYSFYSGRLGVAYCLAKIYTLTKDEVYKKEALEIALKAGDFFEIENLKYDLLVGPPGCIIGLLHIYEATSDARLLSIIDLFTSKVLDNIYVSEAGVYWNRGRDYMKGLCGFSHGASGMAYVFLELGRYFNNNSFLWLAGQVFKYENAHYEEKINNWPDFRRSMFLESDYAKFLNAYEQKNIDFFTKGGDFNAWCHGAAGIGLARVRAIELLPDATYKTDLQNAINKTIKTNVAIKYNETRSTFIICHGACGNAETFLEASLLLKDEQLMLYTKQIADAAIEDYNKNGGYISGYSFSTELNDTSLFMGNAGIGYFMLRLNNPEKTESILAPKLTSAYSAQVDKEKFKTIGITISQLKKIIVEKTFPRTKSIIERNFPQSLDIFFENMEMPEHSLQKVFFDFVQQSDAFVKSQLIQEISGLEWEKYMVNESIESDVLNYVQILFVLEKFKQYQALPENDFLKLKLKFTEGAKIITTHLDWQEPTTLHAAILQLPEDEHYVLLLPTLTGTLEIEISEILATLLDAFSDTSTVESVLNEVLTNFAGEPEDVRKQIKESVIKNIMYGIQKGMLVPA